MAIKEQPKVQVISASHIAEFETDSHSEQESNQEQLDVDVHTLGLG